jgi:hypothetical protein
MSEIEPLTLALTNFIMQRDPRLRDGDQKAVLETITALACVLGCVMAWPARNAPDELPDIWRQVTDHILECAQDVANGVAKNQRMQ